METGNMPWQSGAFMRCVWIGFIVMGLAYAIFLREPGESLVFVLGGQVFGGALGLVREIHLSRLTAQSRPTRPE